MLKLREWFREWRNPTPARHPGLDEPFTPAESDRQREELLTRWREIAMWVITIPQELDRPEWWDAADHFAVSVIFAEDREWMVAGVTGTSDVRAVPVADAVAYLGKVLAIEDTTAVAAAMKQLHHDFAWAKTADVVAAAMTCLKGGNQ